MKRLLLVLIFIIFNINIYANNTNSDLVDITVKNDFIFKDEDFKLSIPDEDGISYYKYVYYKNENNLFLINENKKSIIEKIYLSEKKNIYYIMKHFNIFVPADETEKAMWGEIYDIDIYKKYDNFFLQIIYLYKAPNGSKFVSSKYDGFEGSDQFGKDITYLYRDFKNMQKLNSELVIDDNQILISLEEFIKADNNLRNYEPPILFKESSFNLETLKAILNDIPISQKALAQYNDIAYYLQQSNANDEAIFLLEEILEKFPNRTVAYINLADAYLGINDIEKAKQNYKKYIELMKQDNKEEKIPKRVLEFLKN